MMALRCYTWAELQEYAESPEGKREGLAFEQGFRKGYWHGLLAAVDIVDGGDPRQIEWWAYSPVFQRWYCGDCTKIIDPPKCEPWKRIRLRILKRDNGECGYCGNDASHVDHIIPVSKGGSYEDDNLIASCKKCNVRKGTKSTLQWLAVRRGRE